MGRRATRLAGRVARVYIERMAYDRKMQLRYDAQFEEALDEIRRSLSPIPTSSEVIRDAVFRRRDQLRGAAKRRGPRKSRKQKETA